MTKTQTERFEIEVQFLIDYARRPAVFGEAYIYVSGALYAKLQGSDESASALLKAMLETADTVRCGEPVQLKLPWSSGDIRIEIYGD